MSKPTIVRAFGPILLALSLTACGAPAGTAATSVPSSPASTSAPAPTAAGAATSAPAPTAAPVPTAAPLPTTSAPAPTGQPGASADVDLAVQVVADYYAAIDQKQFDAAYQLWANGGQASGQSLEQFRQGFAHTVATQLRLGAPQAAGDGVSVPVELAAIDDGPNQQVAQFRGSYTLARGAEGWRLAAAAIEPGTGALPPADRGDPAQALQQYYAAIGSHNPARAYTFWGGNGSNSGQRYADFARGFASTAQVQVFIGPASSDAAAGSLYSSIPAVVEATQTDGSQQTFCGSYTMRRLIVPPFDQLGWRIERAEIAPHAAIPAGEAAAQQLLTSGCK